MSSAGSGEIAAAAGLAIGGAVVLAVGATILIGKGIVWCGQKLEENYQNACGEWTKLAERARAENTANVEDMGAYIADQLSCMSAQAYLAVNPSSPPSASVVPSDSKEVLDALTHTRQALSDAKTFAQNKADTAQQLLVYRLQTEIEAGRNILPAECIRQAEAALYTSPDAIRHALNELENAWKMVTEEQALNSRTIRQAQQILSAVTTQLAAIDSMLLDVKGPVRSAYVRRQQAIEEQIRNAQDQLIYRPSYARVMAVQTEKETRSLIEDISNEMMATWNSARKEVNTQRGMLDSLSQMLKEATAVQIVDAEEQQTLANRIAKAQKAAEALTQGTTVGTPRNLALLKERVELLKRDVFAVVKTKQQRNLAQTIAATLAELGFTSSTGNTPALKHNGDVMRIEATISKATPGSGEDEKVVSFDIGVDSNITYDFSGYVGDSCVQDAKRVFDALRKKGIFILDAQGSQELQALPASTVTAETLQQDRFQPTITKNKTQADLAESLKRVLEKMNFPEIKQSVIGGFIELEAFKGNIGYRVVLSPDGNARITKDRADVSENEGDPVTAEAKRTMRQEEERQRQQEEEEREERERQQEQKRRQQGHGRKAQQGQTY